MVIVNDADGKWEVEEGIGCINKRLVEPSAGYLASHPDYGIPQVQPTLEEVAARLTDAMSAIMVLSLE